MLVNHPQICLYQPEIPQNTGNIGRLAAATGSRLHLIKPLGFSLSDKNLRRPGLDYWPFLDLEIHEDPAWLFKRFNGKIAFFSKHGSKSYDQVPIDTELLVFGRETSGLPEAFRKDNPDAFYSIPMYHSGVRSLNLSNSVAIVLYDQLRQRRQLQTKLKGGLDVETSIYHA